MIQFHLPFLSTRGRKGLSERELAQETGLARNVIRSLAARGNVTIKSIESISERLDYQLSILATPDQIFTQYSSIAVALLVERDGNDSWRIHFFNLVDEFRRTLDVRLILLPPHHGFDKKLGALLASIVRDLCEQTQIDTPLWAMKRCYLDSPWFPSEMQSLKASALLESPLPYRSNNIFVQSNFLARV